MTRPLSGDAPARIAQGNKQPVVWAGVCPTCKGDGDVAYHETGGTYIGKCRDCGGRGTDQGRHVHPLASIGDPPEHRDVIAGNLKPLTPGVELGRFVWISAGVTVDAGIHEPTRVGDGTLVMAKAHVAHDCQVGTMVEIGAGAVLCGHVTVGDGAKVNGLAFVRPFITVGAGAHVGGGAVVVKDVPPNTCVVGNPARFLRFVDPRRAFEPTVQDYADAAAAKRAEWARDALVETAREEYAERCMETRAARIDA